jgi:hypothetical protein
VRRGFAAAGVALTLALAACAPAPGTPTTTTRPVSTTQPPTTSAPTTTTAKPTTTTRPVTPAEAPVFAGLGAWADTYDWSPTVTGGRPTFTAADIDVLAARHVHTLNIQTSRSSLSADIVDESALKALISKAHTLGIKVVGWYLPTFVDTTRDIQRFKAMDRLNLDGIAMDIEALNISDISVRNQRFKAVTTAVRSHIAGRVPFIAITFPPIHLQYVNPSLWADFPWTFVGQNFDALMTMSYWTIRRSSSPYRDPAVHVAEDLRLAPILTGNPRLPVHIVGGLTEQATAAEVGAFATACGAGNCVGGSLYEAATTTDAQWNQLGPLVNRR